MGLNAPVSSVLNRLLPQNAKRNPTFKPTNLITNTILNHINTGHFRKAVSILFTTPHSFPFPIYAKLFQLCSKNLALVETRKLESHLITFCSNPYPPTFLLNRAIEGYGKCGCMEDAQDLFDEMPRRDGGSWNAMISGYAKQEGNGYSWKALLLFCEMNEVGIVGTEVTYASVLKCCGVILVVGLIRQVHGVVVKHGFVGNVILESSLVDVYGKCGIMRDMRRMFDEIEHPNEITWNVIVRRYLQMGKMRDAVIMFFKAVASVRPLNFTFRGALMACSSISALKEGCQIHGVVVKVGFEENEVILNSLIDMYTKSGGLEEGRRLFDYQPGLRNVVSWTSIVSGYALYGRLEDARGLFNVMPERNIVSWNAMLSGYIEFFQWEEALSFIYWMRITTKDVDYVTLGLILRVCSGLSDVVLGKQVHGFVYRHEFYSYDYVTNALIDMYGKCGNLGSSRNCFFEMGQLRRDKVSWNALITSYASHGLSEEALRIFEEMQWETTPSEFTFSTILAACANIFALAQGKQIHCYMLRNGYDMDVVVNGALVDMYSKCRCIEYAINIFEEAVSMNLILWNSMILGCAHNGKGRGVFELFDLMKEKGIKADHVTFQGVLRACISEGFVDLGKHYFESMSGEYCVIPRLEHYESMIELFSRTACMDELEAFVQNMPFEPTVPVLKRVIDACKEHGHSGLEEWAVECLNKRNGLTPF